MVLPIENHHRLYCALDFKNLMLGSLLVHDEEDHQARERLSVEERRGVVDVGANLIPQVSGLLAF